MKNKTNILIAKTKHLSLYKTEQGFYYCQRRTINSVAILCFQKINNQYRFLIRYQPLPEIAEKTKWDDLYACPITGSIEKEQTALKCVINEIREEGGIIVDKSNLLQFRENIATTQMNEKVFYFLADTTNCKQETPQNDGTKFEAVSQNVWVDQKMIEHILDNQIHLASLSICYYHFLKTIIKKV
ncbi:MAG: NUDIX domain-containing protein [Malacoplasma sp.]|nr:NUDIX domain-containing protein [Malacoplasma sp.]